MKDCYFVTTSLIGWVQAYNQPCASETTLKNRTARGLTARDGSGDIIYAQIYWKCLCIVLLLNTKKFVFFSVVINVFAYVYNWYDDSFIQSITHWNGKVVMSSTAPEIVTMTTSCTTRNKKAIKSSISGSGNGLWPDRHDPLPKLTLTCCQLDLYEQTSLKLNQKAPFSFKKMHLQISSSKCRPVSPGFNGLTPTGNITKPR